MGAVTQALDPLPCPRLGRGGRAHGLAPAASALPRQVVPGRVVSPAGRLHSFTLDRIRAARVLGEEAEALPEAELGR